MERSLFRYIWQHSRRDQIIIMMVVLVSFPFYFISLDLPKQIVNEAIQGRAFTEGRTTALFLQLSVPLPTSLGGTVRVFEGVQLPRIEYLFALSGLFLLLVIVNGAFKYVINIQKGVLGERVLRRLRYELFARLLRFRPETLRNVKPAEAATMIKDEVEPIGGFMGDAFVTPLFLAGQAITALLFIFVQNVWLGLTTAAVIGIQGFIIPKLRREQLRLGKERQLASRQLAGRVGEVVEGMAAIQIHGTGRFERSDIGNRLGHLFLIRLKLYERKFQVKFLNNLLAQMTPFLFFAIGGYLALMGQIDIGQLVAVIAAYRDVPPPIKELIDWDQQRQDVEIKYEQVLLQFAVDEVLPDDEPAAPAAPTEVKVEARSLTLRDMRGNALVDNLNLVLSSHEHAALVGGSGDGQDAFAKALGRRMTPLPGHLFVGGCDVATTPGTMLARLLAYVGPDPVIVSGSIRDNALYGLKTSPPPAARPADSVAHREARRTDNSVDPVDADWIDYAAAGATGPGDIDDRIIDALQVVGLHQDVYRFGLASGVSPQLRDELAGRIVEARAAVRAALAGDDRGRLVEPFDLTRYNRNASIGENLLFGVPVGDTFADANLATHPFARAIIEGEGLTQVLTDVGLKIAETMLEIFQGMPAGHSLFERFSFISADELPQFEMLVQRWKSRRRSDETASDRDRLIRLSLLYIEPRHRLGLISEQLQNDILAARASFRKMVPPDLQSAVEFYDPDQLCVAAPLRDNLLFGRIAYGVSGAAERVQNIVREVVESLGLTRDIYRVGLDYQVGLGGRALIGTQRAALDIARCLVKRPPMLVLHDAVAAFGDGEGVKLLGRIAQARGESGLIVTLREDQFAGLDTLLPSGTGFARIIRFANGQVVKSEDPTAPAEAQASTVAA